MKNIDVEKFCKLIKEKENEDIVISLLKLMNKKNRIALYNYSMANVLYLISLMTLINETGEQKLFEEFLDLTMKSNNAEYIYKFSCYAKNVPIDKLAEAIIKTNDAEYIYKFAYDIEGAPIDKLADAIIKTNNAEYIYDFAYDIAGAPVGKLAEAIIKTNNVEYIYDFAYEIYGAPVGKLAKAIIKNNDAEYIYRFACYIGNAPVGKLAAAIIKTNNVEYIYKFAYDIAGAPIDKLAEAIIKTNDVEYIYWFACYIGNAPIDKLAEAIIKTNDAEYIYKFVRYIENAPIAKLADAIIKTNDLEYIYAVFDFLYKKSFDITVYIPNIIKFLSGYKLNNKIHKKEQVYFNKIVKLFDVKENIIDSDLYKKENTISKIQQGQGKIAWHLESLKYNISAKEKLEIIKFWAINNRLDLLDIYAPYILSSEPYDPIGLELDNKFELKNKKEVEKVKRKKLSLENKKG